MNGNDLIILSLGTNLGDRIENLKSAISKISKSCELVKISSIYETEAKGYKSQNKFLNLCLAVTSKLAAESLLEAFKQIEEEMGRIESTSGYNDRIIDIDIIFFGGLIISHEKLQIPHSKYIERLFVLVPLNEIFSNYRCPIRHTTIDQLLKNCGDTTPIIKYYSDISFNIC